MALVVFQPGWEVHQPGVYDVVNQLAERTGRTIRAAEGDVFPPLEPGELGYVWPLQPAGPAALAA